MTSQLNVDTIVDKAGSGGTNVKVANTSTYVSDGGGATQNTVQGLAKVWIQASGDGTSITDSFNVGSITDVQTGNASFSYTNSMSNDDSSLTMAHKYNSSTGSGSYFANDGNRLTSSHDQAHYQNGSLTDPTRYNGTIHGDLA